MAMSRSIAKKWAQEEIADAVDAFVEKWKADNPEEDWDVVKALEEQAVRVRKYFNLEKIHADHGVRR